MKKWPKELGLDGVYIRIKVDDKWGSRCLTDCPWDIVEEWLQGKSKDYQLEVIKHLHEKMIELGSEIIAYEVSLNM